MGASGQLTEIGTRFFQRIGILGVGQAERHVEAIEHGQRFHFAVGRHPDRRIFGGLLVFAGCLGSQIASQVSRYVLEISLSSVTRCRVAASCASATNSRRTWRASR